MEYSPGQRYKAAQAIQPYIKELLSAPKAQALSQQLEVLLANAAQPQTLDSEAFKVLFEHEPIRAWMRLYLEEDYPAEQILKALRVYYPLPELKHPIESPRYICPVEYCHQDWYRQSREAEIPYCPVHDLQLVIDS